MIDSETATRSEIADIQNSLVQGADGILLDKETAYGNFPIESVATASKTIAETGHMIDPEKKFKTLYSI